MKVQKVLDQKNELRKIAGNLADYGVSDFLIDERWWLTTPNLDSRRTE